MELNKIYCGDALQVLKDFPAESVNMVMTSPPYWGLRDYGTANWEGGDPRCNHFRDSKSVAANTGQKNVEGGIGHGIYKEVCKKCGAARVDNQLGLEKTFTEYIDKLCNIFDEVKRVIRKDGTCWVNLGDSYGGGSGGYYPHEGELGASKAYIKRPSIGMGKSLCLIPQRFAIEMVNRGWILRNVIIWYKRNCMPSSVKDRFTVDFEYIYFFVRSKKYWYEQQYEAWTDKNLADIERAENKHPGYNGKYSKGYNEGHRDILPGQGIKGQPVGDPQRGRNKRCVWDITTRGYKEAHFATFPEELCITPIRAGCPEFVCKKCEEARKRIEKYTGRDISKGGDGASLKYFNSGLNLSKTSSLLTKTKKEKEYTSYSDCGCNAGFEPGIVLDPFCGAGTTCLVAKKLGRNYIGIELNQQYAEMARARIQKEAGLL